MIRELVLQFKLGSVGLSYFQNKFGVDLTRRFAEPLGQLRQDGFLEQDAEVLRLTRQGLLQVDRLVRGFFLPEHSGARYA